MLAALALSVALGQGSVPAEDACDLVLRLLDGDPEAAATIRSLGRDAGPVVAAAFEMTPTPEQLRLLLETLAEVGDVRQADLTRPLIYSHDPVIATAATYALARTAGARALSTFEHLLRSGRSRGQTLAAIHALRELHLRSTFDALAAFASDASHDPVLRGEAVRALTAIDEERARKWLAKLGEAQKDSAFLAEVRRVAESLLLPKAGDKKAATRR